MIFTLCFVFTTLLESIPSGKKLVLIERVRKPQVVIFNYMVAIVEYDFILLVFVIKTLKVRKRNTRDVQLPINKIVILFPFKLLQTMG